jgi:hypothetical protein
VLLSICLALRLRSAVGDSPVADDWGREMSARGLYEVMGQGGLGGELLGPWTAALAVAAVIWTIWAGWKVQAGAAGVAAKPAPLLLSVPSALVAGLLPLWTLHALLWGALGLAAASGIQFLGWADFVFSPLLHMCFASSLLIQWWLYRLDMADGRPRGARAWLRHLKVGFLRLWSHPIQWGAIVFFGASVRTGLSFSALLLAWAWGAQSLPRLCAACAVQAAAAAANAWLIGWGLRTIALYWRNETIVDSG